MNFSIIYLFSYHREDIKLIQILREGGMLNSYTFWISLPRTASGIRHFPAQMRWLNEDTLFL